jgi:hypothetical protein
MGIARSTYYDRPEKAVDDTAIVEAMFAISEEFELYGYRRVGAALRQQGLVVNHKKIRRLMREHDLEHQHMIEWRTAALGAIPTRQGAFQIRTKSFKVDKRPSFSRLSPFADRDAKRSSTSKNPACRAILAPKLRISAN